MTIDRFDDQLQERLRDPDYARAFLETAYENDGMDGLRAALLEIIGAQQGGVSEVARKSGRSRTSLYKSLAANGDPRISTLESLLDSVGMELRPVRKNPAKTTVNA